MIVGGKMADPANDKYKAGSDPEDRVEPRAKLFTGRQPCVDLL